MSRNNNNNNQHKHKQQQQQQYKQCEQSHSHQNIVPGLTQYIALGELLWKQAVQDKCFCDVTFKVDTECDLHEGVDEFNCHAAVLSACEGAMCIFSKCNLKKRNAQHHFQIKGVQNSSCIEVVLRYMYTKQVVPLTPPRYLFDNYFELCAIATLFGLSGFRSTLNKALVKTEGEKREEKSEDERGNGNNEDEELDCSGWIRERLAENSYKGVVTVSPCLCCDGCEKTSGKSSSSSHETNPYKRFNQTMKKIQKTASTPLANDMASIDENTCSEKGEANATSIGEIDAVSAIEGGEEKPIVLSPQEKEKRVIHDGVESSDEELLCLVDTLDGIPKVQKQTHCDTHKGTNVSSRSPMPTIMEQPPLAFTPASSLLHNNMESKENESKTGNLSFSEDFAAPNVKKRDNKTTDSVFIGAKAGQESKDGRKNKENYCGGGGDDDDGDLPSANVLSSQYHCEDDGEDEELYIEDDSDVENQSGVRASVQELEKSLLVSEPKEDRNSKSAYIYTSAARSKKGGENRPRRQPLSQSSSQVELRITHSQSQEKSVDERFFTVVRSVKDLYVRVLQYEPIPLSELKCICKENGLSLNTNDLSQLCDKQGITFSK
eukprot:m.165653 g.165653  ORF g.165653 m.165653 type:complete len:604 (+) comp13439_c0_seq2:1030-2841(+)